MSTGVARVKRLTPSREGTSPVEPRISVKVQNLGFGSSMQCYLSLHGYGVLELGCWNIRREEHHDCAESFNFHGSGHLGGESKTSIFQFSWSPSTIIIHDVQVALSKGGEHQVRHQSAFSYRFRSSQWGVLPVLHPVRQKYQEDD